MQEATDAWLGQVAAQLQPAKNPEHKAILLNMWKKCTELVRDEVLHTLQFTHAHTECKHVLPLLPGLDPNTTDCENNTRQHNHK